MEGGKQRADQEVVVSRWISEWGWAIACVLFAGAFGFGVVALFGGAAKLSRREGHDPQKSWDGGVHHQPTLTGWPIRQHVNPATDDHDPRLAPPSRVDRKLQAFREMPGERTEPIGLEHTEPMPALKPPATYISNGDKTSTRQ
jgi:hypothetical protein